MKIYISCTRTDRDYADRIIQQLYTVNPRWEFIAYHTEEKIGDDFREVVSKNIRTADAVIFIISQRFNESRYGLLELDWTLAYYYEHHSPILIPIILDDAKVPYDIQQFLYFAVDRQRSKDYGNDTDVTSEVCVKLAETLSRIDTQNSENRAMGFTKRLNKNGSIYIQETKQRLEKQVDHNKKMAYVCYGICFLLLCFCAITCFVTRSSSIESVQGTYENIRLAIYNIAILSFLIATARFSFVLGKSFMVEAIRNMDRIHAIDFGDFYLKLFEERFEWSELKEILQNWNIDKGSAFISQDAKDIDPAVLNMLTEAAKHIKKD